VGEGGAEVRPIDRPMAGRFRGVDVLASRTV
jgi:hypothetical protein